jgi:hypothetical protein
VLSSVLLSRLNLSVDEIIGIICVDFDVINQLLIDILHPSDTEEDMGMHWDCTVDCRFKDSL